MKVLIKDSLVEINVGEAQAQESCSSHECQQSQESQESKPQSAGQEMIFRAEIDVLYDTVERMQSKIDTGLEGMATTLLDHRKIIDQQSKSIAALASESVTIKKGQEGQSFVIDLLVKKLDKQSEGRGEVGSGDVEEKVEEIDQTLLSVIQSLGHVSGKGSGLINKLEHKISQQHTVIKAMSEKLQHHQTLIDDGKSGVGSGNGEFVSRESLDKRFNGVLSMLKENNLAVEKMQSVINGITMTHNTHSRAITWCKDEFKNIRRPDFRPNETVKANGLVDTEAQDLENHT